LQGASLNKLKYVLFCGLLVVAFQNCAQQQFSNVDSQTLASTSDSGEDTGVVPAGNDSPTVCDPFSAGSVCAIKSGLLANVYYYPNGVGVQNYIDYGTLLPIYIQLSNLNIPLRKWTDGFPGLNGNLLADNSGNPLVEYFALDLKGYLELVAGFSEDSYEFALASDDGAILDIDGEVVVDNDGTHPTQWKCSTKSINLMRGQQHAMRVRYYQGPRDQIALQVFWRPIALHGQPCDATGGWTIVPPEVLHH
jgi:hypothetical protein